MDCRLTKHALPCNRSRWKPAARWCILQAQDSEHQSERRSCEAVASAFLPRRRRHLMANAHINAEWSEWIKTNVERGCSRDVLFRILADEGFDAEVIAR